MPGADIVVKVLLEKELLDRSPVAQVYPRGADRAQAPGGALDRLSKSGLFGLLPQSGREEVAGGSAQGDALVGGVLGELRWMWRSMLSVVRMMQ